MTTITILPGDEQVSDLLDSPMTQTERSIKLQLEATSKAAAEDKFVKQRIMAGCLLTIYQDRLFRGEQGGRNWSDYLANDLQLLGYGKLSLESATLELNWCVLCNAIDDWNAQNPHKQLGYPKGRSYMEGWTTLFDRRMTKGGGSAYMPFSEQPAEAALKTWATACFRQGNKGGIPSQKESAAFGRQARDQGLGVRTAIVGTSNISNRSNAVSPAAGERNTGHQPQEQVGEVRDRVLDPEVLRQAEEAKAARQAAKADPRDFTPLQKHDPIPMNEAENYCNIMGRLQMEAQTLREWVRGALNDHGTDGLNFLRNNIDLGLYAIDDDIKRVTAIREMLTDTLDMLSDHYEPGELPAGSFTAEPTL